MVRQNEMKTEMKDWCNHQSFVQEKWRDTIEWQNVCEISNLLIQYLNEKEIAAQISVANQPGARSKPKCNILWGKMWHGKKLQPIEY